MTDITVPADRMLFVRVGRRYVPAEPRQVMEAAREYAAGFFRRGQAITGLAAANNAIRDALATLEHEVFAVLWLDNRHNVIAFDHLFRGTIRETSVYSREVVKAAMQRNAAACILAHNHPSGDPSPGLADEKITKRLRDALELVDVRVLDHIVVGGNETKSLAACGLM